MKGGTMYLKILSGRWILTVASAVVFIYAVVKGILDAAATATILMFIFREYFSQGGKKDINAQNGK